MNTENRSFKILMADDGSEHAQAAIQFVLDLPDHHCCSIAVISVLTQRQISERDRFDNMLMQTKAVLEAHNFTVAANLLIGHPAEKIISTANETKPDLIVLGAIGLRATLGILLGGVAQQVVENSTQPVLIVRAPYRGIHKVLLATDGSERSQKTLSFLINFPLPKTTEFRVMHVLPPLPSPEIITRTWPMGSEAIPPLPPATLTEEFNKWEAEEKQEGQKILEQTVNTLKTAGKDSTSILKRGDAATEIINYAKSDQIDLIVAGSRGISQVQGWLLGSVSRKLIHYAGCSILIIK